MSTDSTNPQTRAPDAPARVIGPATVVRNVLLCREHYRLTLSVARFPEAHPGQFVQLSPPSPTDHPIAASAIMPTPSPMLPRAFSIGGLRRAQDGCEVDVIYRVVGVATQWMAGRASGDQVTLLGPLGNPFPISPTKPHALLIIGGVGLPPLLWLAEALRGAGKQTVAFIGAQTADLLPLDCADRPAPDVDAAQPRLCAAEFAATDTPVIISTDDGSRGYQGHAVAALTRYLNAVETPREDCVVYTCGPERMMRATADYCLANDIECHVCLERPMACGVGTCQSCIVTVQSAAAPSGRRFVLCCSEGPVFPADVVVWDHADH